MSMTPPSPDSENVPDPLDGPVPRNRSEYLKDLRRTLLREYMTGRLQATRSALGQSLVDSMETSPGSVQLTISAPQAFILSAAIDVACESIGIKFPYHTLAGTEPPPNKN